MTPRKHIERLETLEGCNEFANDLELYLKNQRTHLLVFLAEDDETNRDLAEATLAVVNRDIDELSQVQMSIQSIHLEDDIDFIEMALQEGRERITSIIWGDIHPNSQYARHKRYEDEQNIIKGTE